MWGILFIFGLLSAVAFLVAFICIDDEIEKREKELEIKTKIRVAMVVLLFSVIIGFACFGIGFYKKGALDFSHQSLEPKTGEIYILKWEEVPNFLIAERDEDPKKAPLLLSKKEWELPPNIKVGGLIELLNLNKEGGGEKKFFVVEFNGGEKIIKIPFEFEVEEKKK